MLKRERGRVMPEPMKNGAHISVERKSLGTSYSMKTLEMAMDYYELGYIISGDRKVITPTETYFVSAGGVGLTPPYIYHKTMAASDELYERILIKFTPEYVEPFIEEVGLALFEQLYEQKICYFTENTRKKVEQLFMEMVEEAQKEHPHREFFLQGMLFRLLYTIYEERLPAEGIVQNVTPLTPPIMDAIVFVEAQYANNPSLEEAAAVAGFSAAYFSRLFSSQLGMSYTEYLDNIKIRHAQILLAQSKKSIMEIAGETGYCHGNYLNSQFKKKVGMTPGEYRKKYREKKGE